MDPTHLTIGMFFLTIETAIRLIIGVFINQRKKIRTA